MLSSRMIRLQKICGTVRRAVTIRHCSQNHQTSPEENEKPYDVHTYQFPYTSEEKSTILDVINEASEETFIRLKVSKGITKKILKNKLQVGEFKDMNQLLDIDGMGIKSVERLCSLVLKKHGEKELMSSPQETDFVYRKRLVKPKVQPYLIKNLQTLVALDVTIGFIAWTKIDSTGVVLDVDCEELLTPSSRLDFPKLYEKVVNIARRLPEADAYIWEEKANYGHLQGATLGTVIVSLQLAQVRGMLTALLDPRNDMDGGSRLFHLRDTLVSKLFRIQVGHERISGINLADQLIKGYQLLEWLPPLEVGEETRTKFISADKSQRRHMATSLFIGTAFSQVLLQQNQKAIKVLMK